MPKTRLALALAAGLALPASAQTLLDPVVVTPSRMEEPLSDALAATSVLTRADLDRSQARTLLEALSHLPGVGIARTGGEGQASSLFIRGTESRHVAVFIDGVRMGSATLGLVALQDIPLAHIERIELVRGPQSGLYGSDAIGGTLQIFTRKGRGFEASLTAGSRDTQRAAVQLGAGSDAAWLSLGASLDRTDGINACDPRAATLFKACFANEPDRDGYRNRALNLAGGGQLTAGTRVEAHALLSDSKLEYDGSFQNQSETRQQVLGASLNQVMAPVWTTRFSVSQSRDESRNFKDGVFGSRFDTRMNQAAWENIIGLPAGWTLLAGVDHLDESVSSTTAYTVRDRQTTGLFVQARGALAGLALQGNLRHADNSQFGDHVTGNIAARHALTPALAVRASVGTAFKAPTFNDLYFPGFGNANLKPEESVSREIAIEGHHAQGRWTVAAFHTDIDNLVIFTGSGPANNADARIRGLEAAWLWMAGPWQVSANLTLQDPENRTVGINQGKQLARRAKQMANIDISRQTGAWTLGGALRAESARFDNAGNTDRMGGYAVLDLRAETRLARAWRLAVKLENVTDRSYETAFLYNQPGRGAFVTLGYALPK